MENMLIPQVYQEGRIMILCHLLTNFLHRLCLSKHFIFRGSILSSISSVIKSSSSGDGGYAAYGQAPPIIQVQNL